MKTLVLDANGLTWKAVLADTMLKGCLGVKSDSWQKPALYRHTWRGELLGPRNESLSYVMDWREAFEDTAELDVELCNITNLVEYFRCLRNIAHYALIIILHSATADRMSLLLRAADRFNRRRGRLVVFVGNEYNLMEDKIRFTRWVEADYICSQLPLEAARWLYAECDHSQILSIPHALNPKMYFPDPFFSRRSIDMGFMGDIYHHIIGDGERTNLIRYFEQRGESLGLTCHIRNQRLPRKDWARFLNTCKGILGAESGTYYLDRKSQRIIEFNALPRKHFPDPLTEAHQRLNENKGIVISGKAISSRHFEAIGTKTCQVLVEGHYNGILKANEHYLSVKKDLSNIEEVIRQFKDDAYRNAMVERAYEYVLASHTYRHRVELLLATVMKGRH